MFSLGRRIRNRHAPARRSVANLAEFQPSASDPIKLRSTSFDDGGPIPLRYSGRGDNVSPQLSWSGVPSGTAQLLLIIEDPDVPLPRPIIHTVALFDATGTDGVIAEGELSQPSSRFTFIPWFRTTGYHGPRPLRGHGDHHYGFYLFALDRKVATTSYRQLRREIAGHMLARGVITGTQRFG